MLLSFPFGNFSFWQSRRHIIALFANSFSNYCVPNQQKLDNCARTIPSKSNEAPFAVVVHLVEIEQRRRFSFCAWSGIAFQPDHVKHTGFCQQAGQMIQAGSGTSPCCPQRGLPVLKGQPGADGADPPTSHTDGVSLFPKRVCSR